MPVLSQPGDRAKRKALWNALNHFILHNGGWIVSTEGAANVRFETLSDSGLVQALIDAGYDPVSAGTAEKLLPVSIEIRELGTANKIKRDQLQPTQVEVWTFKLPS